jgi:hypothetical protein
MRQALRVTWTNENVATWLPEATWLNTFQTSQQRAQFNKTPLPLPNLNSLQIETSKLRTTKVNIIKELYLNLK